MSLSESFLLNRSYEAASQACNVSFGIVAGEEEGGEDVLRKAKAQSNPLVLLLQILRLFSQMQPVWGEPS
jgi:hypothetical protein